MTGPHSGGARMAVVPAKAGARCPETRGIASRLYTRIAQALTRLASNLSWPEQRMGRTSGPFFLKRSARYGSHSTFAVSCQVLRPPFITASPEPNNQLLQFKVSSSSWNIQPRYEYARRTRTIRKSSVRSLGNATEHIPCVRAQRPSLRNSLGSAMPFKLACEAIV